MKNHGYGRSEQGRERRANLSFEKRLQKRLDNVDKMDKIREAMENTEQKESDEHLKTE